MCVSLMFMRECPFFKSVIDVMCKTNNRFNPGFKKGLKTNFYRFKVLYRSIRLSSKGLEAASNPGKNENTLNFIPMRKSLGFLSNGTNFTFCPTSTKKYTLLIFNGTKVKPFTGNHTPSYKKN